MIVRALILLLTSFHALTAVAQETELDKRNGFKDIKLATSIDSVRGAIFKKDFKEKGHFQAKLYEVEHPDYESIGEVKVNKIEIKTYKDFVYEIFVVTDKDTRLMKGMEMALGRPVYDVREESYNWTGKNLILKFKSHSKKELELRYNSSVVYQMMKDDKAKKIENIADDF